MTQFKYTVGDWSDDGHGKYETFVFETDSSIADVHEAIKKMNKEFPEFSTLCKEYEDSSVPDDVAFKLDELGFDIEDRELEYFFDGADDYADTWAFLLNKFTPELVLERVKETKMPTIHGGGYGLFWS